MKLIIGLGNPGMDYSGTRHNVGHMVIDELQKMKIPNVILRKTDVFMNQSGDFVSKILKAKIVAPEDLYIVHDDLDIPFGEFKIQFGKGPRDHNGVKSVDEALGTDQYWHVRVGIENRIKNQESRIRGEDYVLQDFSDEEKPVLASEIKNVCKKLETLLANTN